MDWITGIQCAINYTEAHLTENIDYEAVAREAASSPFHFQRMFTMLCGYTLGDYIRMRRLSLAADELCRTDNKVIDVAMKYGYDTPESFSRAFTKFHGVSPSQARKHKKSVKSFSRIFVKLILDGGNIMDYKIVKLDALKIVCKRKQVNKPQGDTATADISAFWAEVNKTGMMSKLCKYAKFDKLHGVLGICFSGKWTIRAPVRIGPSITAPVADEEFDIVDIPAHTYAVFECRGKMPDAFKDTYKKICTEFFPQSPNYEYGSGIELEVYPTPDASSPDYYCEIWIAVNEKK